MTHATRLTAATAGATKYNTGKPCARGHLSDRYTSTGGCCECLKFHSREFAGALRQAKVPGTRGSLLFTYRLHPDDHAAALAYCQALDLQRGRTPQESQAVVAPEPQRSATREEVAAHRAAMFGGNAAGAPIPAGPAHLSEEMRKTLADYGLPV